MTTRQANIASQRELDPSNEINTTEKKILREVFNTVIPYKNAHK